MVRRGDIVRKLSILMPVFNEQATLSASIERVLATSYGCDVELVVVDDGSTDGTADLLAEAGAAKFLTVTHATNRGKGAAIRTAVAHATGDYMVVCDADLEYAPEDIASLVQPVLDGRAEVVFGTRSFSSHSSFSFWYVVGNKAVTTWANALFNTWISDLETCFKVLPVGLYRALDVRATGFGMEAELTGKLLKLGYRPFEVPVSYAARGRDAGKKLTWRDGVAAVWLLARIRLFTSVEPARAWHPTAAVPRNGTAPTGSVRGETAAAS
ncbi:MAG: dolichol-phosphate hexosyltransferase [Actinomycetota bacterium]|jgi:GT2 family glycosyltransferase|nr:dolichol-phosphate hexosyltransferase [Actinomycetota bacterium]